MGLVLHESGVHSAAWPLVVAGMLGSLIEPTATF